MLIRYTSYAFTGILIIILRSSAYQLDIISTPTERRLYSPIDKRHPGEKGLKEETI